MEYQFRYLPLRAYWKARLWTKATLSEFFTIAPGPGAGESAC
jgi:hypothetical protein